MASSKARLARRLVFMILFIAVVYGGVIGLNRFKGAKKHEAMAAAPAPVMNVVATEAVEATWAEELQAVASLKAVQGTTLTAQSAGTVTAIHFHSGDEVKAGTLLVQLNDNVARAQLAVDQAKLLNARQELARQRRLFTDHTTSESALQSAEAAFNEATAAVGVDQAVIANLQVRSPFDGHLGIRQVSVGQYVSPGAGVVDIQQWDPLLVDFQIPQRDLARIAVGDRIALSVTSVPDRRFDGSVTALGSSFDTATRNLAVQASVPNDDGALRPGMFGEVTISLAASHQVIAVPETAINYNTYGEYIYVVLQKGNDLVAEQRIVQTGVRHGHMVAVTSGIKSGEKVVSEGQVNLYPGAHLKLVPPSKAQDAAAAARPEGS